MQEKRQREWLRYLKQYQIIPVIRGEFIQLEWVPDPMRKIVTVSGKPNFPLRSEDMLTVSIYRQLASEHRRTNLPPPDNVVRPDDVAQLGLRLSGTTLLIYRKPSVARELQAFDFEQIIKMAPKFTPLIAMDF